MFNRRLSTKRSAGSILVGLTGAVMLLCHAAAVSAQSQCWTMAGSTGTVDEAALDIVTLTNNTAAISSAVTTATGDIRYNVLALNGVFGGAMNGKALTVRFADNGPAAQVIIRVRRVHIDTGVLATLGGLNSNVYPPSTVAQTQTEVINCQGQSLTFKTTFTMSKPNSSKQAPAGRRSSARCKSVRASSRVLQTSRFVGTPELGLGWRGFLSVCMSLVHDSLTPLGYACLASRSRAA
jgi:hypothetical protein